MLKPFALVLSICGVAAVVYGEPTTAPSTGIKTDVREPTWFTAARTPTTAPSTAPGHEPATVPAVQAAAANSLESAGKVVAVTVYRGNALVTREVPVKEGQGLMELVVGPLPPQTLDSSLYTEAGDGIRVLTTQYRTHAVQEDTRAEVRAREQQLVQINAANAQIAKEIEVNRQNVLLLGKLENFTAATMTTLTDKGVLSAESTVKLANFIMETRSAMGKAEVTAQQQTQANNQTIEFLQRQINELAAGANRTEREAIIVVDKANAPAGTVRLNYLVGAASWQPQYKLHGGSEKDPVTVEYLASLQQQSGEDWSGVDLVLSTAQPMLSAAPPDLVAMDINASDANRDQPQSTQAVLNKMQRYEAARQLRQQAQQELNTDVAQAQGSLNSAAANEQYAELLAEDQPGVNAPVREGPSVAYHLDHKLTVRGTGDQQVVEIARIDLAPTYFYKAVPVLSHHVYRQAELINKSKFVLLPGEATMYMGTDFVGRMNLPLVAVGETFVAGFGVDPQLQVERTLVAKNRALQGGNQVQTYDYRIRVSSFKPTEVNLQVWDRVPHSQTEAVAVELVKSVPDLSTDADYLRMDRPMNLLRWDLTAKANANASTASEITYEFKLQYAKDTAITDFKAKK